jgi:hypothetical protein
MPPSELPQKGGNNGSEGNKKRMDLPVNACMRVRFAPRKCAIAGIGCAPPVALITRRNNRMRTTDPPF